jgi:hypothetical protein
MTLFLAAIAASNAAAQFVETTVTVLRTIPGPSARANFGAWINNAGDTDGDGVADLIVGAPDVGASTGAAYLYSGKTGARLFTFTPDLTGGHFGVSVSAAGDVDGDGTPDVAVGAPDVRSRTGAVYLYSGRNGALIRRLDGAAAGNEFGFAPAPIPDTNADGRPDLLVGAPGANSGTGAAYVLSGRDGSVLRTMTGRNAGERFGSAVNALRDINGDGRAEILVGAMDRPPSARGGGDVISGAGDQRLFEIPGDASSHDLGWAYISDAGDVDADGKTDILVGDFGHDGAVPGQFAGRAWVYSGADFHVLHTWDGTPQSGLGECRAAGDVNGDGYGDLLIAAYNDPAHAQNAGRVSVYSGRDGSELLRLTCHVAGDQFGVDVAAMGDVNGDGFADFAVSAPGTDGVAGSNQGAVYIISGAAIPQSPAVKPSLTITYPASGATIGAHGQLFLQTTGFELDCGAGASNAAGHGHVRVDIDGQLDSETCERAVVLAKSYAAGAHLVTVSLVNNDGTILSPPISASITVKIAPDVPFVTRLAVPGVGKVKGVGGSFFRTTMWMTNPEATAILVRLRFVATGGFPDGTTERVAFAELQPKQMIRYGDVVTDAFGLTIDVAGVVSIETETQSLPIVAARTFNDTEGGTFGQYIPAVPVGDGVSASRLHGLAGDAASRTNVGVLNVSGVPLKATLTLWDPTGKREGSEVEITVAPWSSWQVNAFNRAAGLEDVSGFSVRMNASSATGFLYGSKLDNKTSDPIFMSRVPSRSSQWLDGVGAVRGEGGSFFRSFFSLANENDIPAHVSIAYTPRGTTAVARTVDVDLPAGHSTSYADVMNELFQTSETAGTLKLTTAETTPVSVWARTYNDRGATGTLGQFIPSFGSENLIGARGALLQGISENEAIRCNLGLINTSTVAIDSEIMVYSSEGQRITSKTYHVEGGQTLFIGHILLDIGAGSQSDTYLIVTPSLPGALYTWASFIDNKSTDPTFVRPFILR